jgi:lipid II:glycine glycyltransferase (peptidoglycan interpeptide bridge formation enzyme)
MPPEKENEFLEGLISFVRQSKLADRIVQPPTHVVFHKAPPETLSCGFGTWFIPLQEKSEEELWNCLHSKNRNVIRNAQKHEVEIKEGRDQLETFQRLYVSTMQRSSMYAETLSEFKNMYELIGPAHILCAVAYYQGMPQGGVLMPYSEAGAYYLHGASASKPEVNGAMNYLHWELICRMKRAGVRRYDFVGTRLSDTEGTRLQGIQQFKERFGSTLEKGVLWKIDINALRCVLYDTILQSYYLIRRIRLKGDIIDQEKGKTQIL